MILSVTGRGCRTLHEDVIGVGGLTAGAPAPPLITMLTFL
jgi:hypothetical protein